MYSSGDAPSTSLDEIFYFDSYRLTDSCTHFLGDPFPCGASFAMADPLSTYPGGFAPRRAPWETTASHQGLWLDDLGELAFPIHFDQNQAQRIPIDQISADMEGFCFATLTTKGYVREKVIKLGFEDERVRETTLSVYDHVIQQKTPRALTLINAANLDADYVELSDAAQALEIPKVERLAVMIEMRQNHAKTKDWEAFGNLSKFDSYVLQLLQMIRCEQSAIQYKTFVRDDYFAKRVLLPKASRNARYARSGLNSIQVRPIRNVDDEPEVGLELLPIETQDYMADIASRHQQREGFLGVFCNGKHTYYRSSDECLVADRQLWYQGQDKWIAQNLGVKTLMHWKISGFPTGTSALEVATTLLSLGIAAVPTKQIHFRELCCVFAFSAKEPPHLKFQTSVGIIQFEKLDPKKRQPRQVAHSSVIAPAPPHPSPATKGKGKGKCPEPSTPSTASTAPSSSSAPSTSLVNRVSMLEQKLEHVQQDIGTVKGDYQELKTTVANMESKQDKGFQDLLLAISELKNQSVSSASVKSPARKAQKQ